MNPSSTSHSGSQQGPELPLLQQLFNKVISNILRSVRQEEPLITKYDTIAGDGDCGTTLLKGVSSLALYSSQLTSDTADLGIVFRQMASLVETNMGGTSGAIYAIFMNAVSTGLLEKSRRTDARAPYPTLLTDALQHGLGELYSYMSARVGQRTMMDALIPFVETFATTGDLSAGVVAAADGAEATRQMEAVLGRTSYISKGWLDREKGGVPDPGAVGVVRILRGLRAGLS
ncbi:hypothetical protein DL769_000344 [Monosporascus sp. CRB-8-3]|nr:hypothetical protein DL769_000344 [Monosporascus sp. CRB-8-3]